MKYLETFRQLAFFLFDFVGVAGVLGLAFGLNTILLKGKIYLRYNISAIINKYKLL